MGYKNPVSHSKNQHILNIVKQRAFGSGGEERREQNHTHKSKFLKFFLDMGQGDETVSPKMDIFHVMPVNSLPFGRQNQIHAVFESTLLS